MGLALRDGHRARPLQEESNQETVFALAASKLLTDPPSRLANVQEDVAGHALRIASGDLIRLDRNTDIAIGYLRGESK